ncbi:MAG: flap endonuclease [Deltaproteobacteria bacterium]|nr:flap endonuclease [Deltaproteobacteria bacterium]
MPQRPKVHLVDGTYELFRSYFGSPARTNAEGAQVGALRGILHSMIGLLRQEDVTHVGVAFDHVIESFRNDMFAGYKTGAGVPVELSSQFHPAERVCRSLGLVVWPMVEFEADDGIASAAARFAADEDVGQVVICTPDKDMAQCVIGDRVIMVDRMRKKQLDEDGVREKFGVSPASIPDYLGLVGDDADGIPGIPRWGAKSTAAVLREYGHLEAIPDDVSAWTVKVRGAATLAGNLAARRGDAMLYRDLAVLRTDAPTPESLEAMRWTGPADDFEAVCDWLGDRRAPSRVPAVK